MQAQKLRKTLTQMFQDIKDRNHNDLDDFYQILAGDLQTNKKKRNFTEHDESQKAQTTRFNIKIKRNSKARQQAQRKVQSVNLNKNLSHSRELKQFNDQKQRLLMHKKKDLLEELQKVDIELKQCHQQKKILGKHKRIVTEQIQQQMYNKASEFIRKMNKQRQEFNKRRKKSAKQVNKSINQSIEVYTSAIAQQEKIKQIKRQQIQKRIQQRKHNSIARVKINKRSNSVIKQLIDITPLHGSLADIKQRMKIQLQIERNPQNSQSYRQQKSNKSLREKSPLQDKKYEVSPFLQKLFKQQQSRKKQAYLKQLQRKRVAEKHKQYADKIRGKAKVYSDSTMFIT